MDKEYISATDLNKYVYCNYSFYYEKKYGAKELRRLKKEYNEKYGYTNNNDNFAKGKEFHDSYYSRMRFKAFARILMFIVIIFFAIYIYNSLR